PEQPIGKRVVSEIPGSEKIIFRPRSIDRRRSLTVHEKHVVAFPKPAVLILQHRHGHAQSDRGRWLPSTRSCLLHSGSSCPRPVRRRSTPTDSSSRGWAQPGGTARGNRADPQAEPCCTRDSQC